jgi:hypothetical protein
MGAWARGSDGKRVDETSGGEPNSQLLQIQQLLQLQFQCVLWSILCTWDQVWLVQLYSVWNAVAPS